MRVSSIIAITLTLILIGGAEPALAGDFRDVRSGSSSSPSFQDVTSGSSNSSKIAGGTYICSEPAPFLDSKDALNVSVSGFEGLRIECLEGKEDPLAAAIASSLEGVGARTSDSIFVLTMIKSAYQKNPKAGEYFDKGAFVQSLCKKISCRPDADSGIDQLDLVLANLSHRAANENVLVFDYSMTFALLTLLTLANLGGLAFLIFSKRGSLKKVEQKVEPVFNSTEPPQRKDGDAVRDNLPALEDQIKPQVEAALVPVNDEVDTLKRKCQQMEGEIGRFHDWPVRLQNIERRLPETPSLPPPDLNPIYLDIDKLKRFALKVQQKLNADPPPEKEKTPFVPVDLEREVLGEVWKKAREHKEIAAVLAGGDWLRKWQGIRNPVLVDLPPSIPDDIKPTFDMILAPARDFDNMVTKINFVPRLLDPNPPRLPSEAQELMRLRELTSLLTMIQNSNTVADRLNFHLEQWVSDQFVSFADLFLQRYQQAQLDGRQSTQAQLDPGLQIVRQVLKIADLEPVDLTPGQTRFDSNRHMGRSTASNPNFADGIIVGVVRNGFIRGGREVIRQPEVIVNRLS